MFYLSQAHLERLKRCPPEFQAVYLEQLTRPTDPDYLAGQQWGKQFHQAMQQLQLGLSLDQITVDAKLRYSLEALLTTQPQLLEQKQQTTAEYRRTCAIGEFILTIICDWITFGSTALHIYDWKTYRQPKHSGDLKNHWQTKLYLYIMAATTNYQPEQLAMTYWFIAPGELPQSLTFAYNQTWHQEIHQDLTTMLSQLQADLEQYFRQGLPLQHPNQQTCAFCASASQHDTDVTLDFLGQKNLEDFLEGIERVQL